MQAILDIAPAYLIASQEHAFYVAQSSRLVDEYKRLFLMADEHIEASVKAAEDGDIQTANVLYEKSVDASDVADVVLKRISIANAKRDESKKKLDEAIEAIERVSPGILDRAEVASRALMDRMK